VLSLKDLFFANEIDCDIDVKVHIIYEQDTDDIINQYIVFCKVLTAQYKQCGQTRKAIEEILRICRDRKVLVEYLKQRKTVIMDIMTTLFEQDYMTALYGKEWENKGKIEGIIEGRNAERLNSIRNLM
jgi:hypothetical protein